MTSPREEFVKAARLQLKLEREHWADNSSVCPICTARNVRALAVAFADSKCEELPCTGDDDGNGNHALCRTEFLSECGLEKETP